MIGTPNSSDSATLSENFLPTRRRTGETAAGLAGDRIAVVDADIRRSEEGDEPTIRQADVEGRRELQVADVLLGRISGETDIVPDIGSK